MPFNQYGVDGSLQTVLNERLRDISTIEQLERNKLAGRRRNGGANNRTAPSSATDVIQGDAEGDIVNDGTYIYELINVTGTGLRLHRVSLAISW